MFHFDPSSSHVCTTAFHEQVCASTAALLAHTVAGGIQLDADNTPLLALRHCVHCRSTLAIEVEAAAALVSHIDS